MPSEPYRSDEYWTSHYNWVDDPDIPDDVTFHDTTFRDGEQQPGVIFTEDEKVELGKLYSDIGMDRIEAGLPLVSEADKNAITRLANADLDADVFAFSRCLKSDVETAVECDVDGIVMEIPSSEHLIEKAYDWTYEEALEYAVEATQYANEQDLYVTFFCIDSSRAAKENLLQILNRVVNEGHADALAIVDTFGALAPHGTRSLTNLISDEFDLPVEAHVHNDFGLGVANTLAAIEAGAECVHTTVSGLGERSGNANFEEVATSLKALYGEDLDLDFKRFDELGERTSKASGVPIPESKPVFGENQFSIEAGILTAWWNRLQRSDDPLTMYPYHWDMVGQDSPRIAIGKMGGLATVEYWCDRLGLEIPSENDQEEILAQIKETSIADKRELELDEFVTIYREVMEKQ